MPESREDSVYLAKLAEQAERYEGDIAIMSFNAHDSQMFRDGRKHEARGFVWPGVDRWRA